MRISIMMKKMAVLISRVMYRLLWILPQKNSILFISFSGQYSDSPKYVYLKLKEKLGDDYEYIWMVNKKYVELKGCKQISHKGLVSLIELATAKVIISNNFLNTYFVKRKDQFVLNTWHGGSPLKTVGMWNDSVDEYDKFFFGIHDKIYSAFISSSGFMTKEVIRKSFGYSGEIIECGLPRNAVFFNPTCTNQCVERVRRYFDLKNPNIGIALYAPTFRGNFKTGGFIEEEQQFDIGNVIKALEKKFDKKFILLFRCHHTFRYEISASNCFQATDYPDMQELMIASDVLITDYSSCMGDFCLKHSPVFLYVPDLEEYIADRGFYWNINELPFPVAKDEKELVRSIIEYDNQKYCKGVDDYLNRLDSYERENTDSFIADRIIKEINYKKRFVNVRR